MARKTSGVTHERDKSDEHNESDERNERADRSGGIGGVVGAALGPFAATVVVPSARTESA